MPLSTVGLLLLALSRLGTAAYTIQDDYTPDNFFSMFSFFTSSDPTDGFVTYVDEGTAQADGLISNTESSVYIGVDNTNVQPNGRPSVRITSNNSYQKGLFILDASHMPGGICGTWPAFWMVGPNWPNEGEIDIIEGVNAGATNQMTLHTSSGCSINNSGFTGTLLTSDCDVNDPTQATNAGCGIGTSDTSSYGSGFNDIQGGVYATEWTDSGISIWWFQRSNIPGDISGGTPDPSGWGEPLAFFQGNCDIDSSFGPQQLVFDTTFCGAWAGNVWSSSSCASQASTCQDFVANNPTAFQGAYWTINSLQVYQDNGSSSSGSPSPTPTPASQASMFAARMAKKYGQNPDVYRISDISRRRSV